jgi:hypothetical protein
VRVPALRSNICIHVRITFALCISKALLASNVKECPFCRARPTTPRMHHTTEKTPRVYSKLPATFAPMELIYHCKGTPLKWFVVGTFIFFIFFLDLTTQAIKKKGSNNPVHLKEKDLTTQAIFKKRNLTTQAIKKRDLTT